MKLTKLLFLSILPLLSYSQSLRNSDDLIGTWQYLNSNQTFTVTLEKVQTQHEGSTLSSIKGHYELYSVDISGNRTVIYKSDRIIGAGYPDRYPYMITGGRYLAYNNSYKFSLLDNTAGARLLRGDLKLKFLSVDRGAPLKILWKLQADGMLSEDEEFNLPREIILTKVQ